MFEFGGEKITKKFKISKNVLTDKYEMYIKEEDKYIGFLLVTIAICSLLTLLAIMYFLLSLSAIFLVNSFLYIFGFNFSFSYMLSVLFATFFTFMKKSNKSPFDFEVIYFNNKKEN